MIDVNDSAAPFTLLNAFPNLKNVTAARLGGNAVGRGLPTGAQQARLWLSSAAGLAISDASEATATTRISDVGRRMRKCIEKLPRMELSIHSFVEGSNPIRG